MSGYSSGAHENEQFQLSYEDFQSLRRDVIELIQRMDAMEAMLPQGHVSDEAHHEAPSKCMGVQRSEGVPSEQRAMAKRIQEYAKTFPRSALERKGCLGECQFVLKRIIRRFFIPFCWRLKLGKKQMIQHLKFSTAPRTGFLFPKYRDDIDFSVDSPTVIMGSFQFFQIMPLKNVHESWGHALETGPLSLLHVLAK